MSNSYLGKDIKKLGFGYMRLPQLSGKEGEINIDIEQTKQMVDKFLDHGYTYFDTAVPYLMQKSEAALRVSLVERYPRKNFQIATKLSPNFVTEALPLPEYFQQSLDNLGVDYVDFYLLHAMDESKYQQFNAMGAWDFVQKMKEEGKIKHVGFSFHSSATFLDQVLTAHPEMEFVQLQLNYADWENKGVQSRLCYEVALKHNKPMTIMEPIKGGTLASLVPKAEEVFKKLKPDDSMASWALNYCASLENVITILSGMSTLEQMEDNLKTIDKFAPMTSEEQNAVKEVVEILDSIPTIPCTDCKYCVKDCPASINIPRYFGIMNLHLRYDADQSKASNGGSFAFASKNASKPSACVSCRKCEGHCPQGIKIVDELKAIANIYE